MQLAEFTNERITQQYTIVANALGEIARVYFFQGRLADAQHLLSASLQLLDAKEATPQQRLKLLLLYGQILSVDHLLTRGNANLLFETAQQARQIAEAAQDQQGLADALCLSGEVHYFTTVVALLQSGASPDSPQGGGKYAEALAYQQQALQLREALHDTRGISESFFQIGVVYERWQQHEQAQAYYEQARQVAEQYDHAFEKTEPARHVAIHAFRQGHLEQALPLALQAVALREAAGFKPYLPLDHLLVREIYEALGDTANAQTQLQKASAIAEEIGQPALVASVSIRRHLQEEAQEEA